MPTMNNGFSRKRVYLYNYLVMPIQFSVPGGKDYDLNHVAIDLNGTLTAYGNLIHDVEVEIHQLLQRGIQVHLLTGDTLGNGKDIAEQLQINLIGTPDAASKRKAVEEMGAEQTVAIGNGNIDVQMFQAAALSIAVVQHEMASSKAIMAADLVSQDIRYVLRALLEQPIKTLIATLRE